jgi:cytochrome P450 family 6
MLLILLISCAVFALFLLLKHQNYFKAQNVAYLKSPPILGAFSDVVLRKKGIYDAICDIYNNPSLKHEPFYGIFLFHKPTLFIKDPELIKRVLIKDFHSFSNRYSSTGADDDIGAPNLFVVKNPAWKHIRAKFSPFFSSGKLKAAYYIIEEMGSRLVGYIEKRSKDGISEINLKTAASLYTVDIIGNIAFGLDPQGLMDVFEEFHKATWTIYGKTFKRSLEISTILLLPVFMKIFKTKLLGSVATAFILKWMPKVISDRENSGLKRNDLIDMIIELRKEKEFTDNVMYAQAGSFLGAGNIFECVFFENSRDENSKKFSFSCQGMKTSFS